MIKTSKLVRAMIMALLIAPFLSLSIKAYSFHEGHGDLDHVEALYEKYRQVWLRNEDEQIKELIDLFSADAALLPDQGAEIIMGRHDIQDYWFPEGRVNGTVVNFQHSIQKSEVQGTLGYVIGRYLLTFEVDGVESTSEGNEIMIARKMDGQWKIITMHWNAVLPY